MATIDFEPLNVAGIRKTEFATMLGVSRVTVYKWLAGGNVHPLRYAKVKKYMDAIVGAIDDKKLPLDEKVTAVFRVDLVKRIILEQLKKG
jgi:transcriptional regulator with XRE-family HTH domain